MNSSGIFDKTIDCHIVSVPMSDHRGCLIHIMSTDILKGNGYWEFNNSLLNDVGFVMQMNTVIDSFFDFFFFLEKTNRIIKLYVNYLKSK